MAWNVQFKSQELPEGNRLFFSAGKREIAVFRQQGRLYAVLNFCPHAGAPICRGKIDHPIYVDGPGGTGHKEETSPTLRCPWHHWEFDLDTGKSLCADGPRIKTYPVREEDGQIWVDY